MKSDATYRPRHGLGLAAVAMAALNAVSAYVLRDSMLMFWYGAAAAFVLLLYAIQIWLVPNKFELQMNQPITKRVAVVLCFLTVLNAALLVARLARV